MAWAQLASIGTGVGLNLWAQNEAARKNKEAAEKNAETQREFAQSGIRWKIEDAKAAGIHPLAALGAQTQSFTPSYVGDNSEAEMVRDMGQNISRAVEATATADERQGRQLQLEGLRLDNDMKRAELAKMKGQIGPAMPQSNSTNFIPGQGNSDGLLLVKPSERTASQPGALHQEAGWRPDLSYARTATGLTPVIPEGLSESMEDDMVGKAMWRYRNSLLPNLTGEGAPPKSMLPKGYDSWRWSVSRQEWQPVESRKPPTWSDVSRRWRNLRNNKMDGR